MMSPKLSVWKRKIIEYVKQGVNLLDVKRTDAKATAKRTVTGTQQQQQQQQPPPQWKLGRTTTFGKKEEKPAEDVFSTIFRCLNFSVAAIISPYPRVTKIWKSLLPPTARDDFPTIWLRTPKKPTIPVLLRGMTGSAQVQVVASDMQASPKMPQGKKETLETFSARMLFEIRSSRKKSAPEPWELDLPPPQRCRLSCPLPPAEFISFEATPPQPAPPSNLKSLVLNFAHPAFQKEVGRGNEHPKFKLDPTVCPPQISPRNAKNKKFNLDLKSFKSNEYTPQVEISPKMTALTFEPVSLSLNYDLVNAPSRIYKDEVLVQVVYSGVTGNDLFITEGKVPCGYDPVILGHEISGKVYAVGRDVHHVKKGDNVAVNPFSACCFCRYCSRGLFSSCQNEGLNNSIGNMKNGGWAQFVVVKKSQVHKIPAVMGLDQAALIQPLSCVLSALSKLNIMYGMTVFIQGLGLSGCLWASVLHSRGHKNVFVTDKSEKRKMQFDALDLDYDIIPQEDINKQSADVIIECSGSPNFMEKSFNIVNSNGKLCFFGKPNPLTEVRCIPYDIIKKEVTIVGNSGNTFCFTEALDVASSMSYRYLDFDRLGVQTFQLKDFKEAFQMKKSGDATKIVFKVDS